MGEENLNTMELIRKRTAESIETKQRLLSDEALCRSIERAAWSIIESLRTGGTVFFAGNGGSAADAQHLAAELVSKFYRERHALASEALSVNTSVITAIGNDYAFERIYARQLEARSHSGDIFVGISTSGNSSNVIQACRIARQLGVQVIGLLGSNGGKMKDLCDIAICVPSMDTPRIQETHIMIGHIVCEIIEAGMSSS